ncbi:hypothetical protein [Crocosphaera chwakensis]|uniref:Uncharacterized protein n=1 Tax=Crocosphaera chwakensis CCY0110 TaxID=391612 RepID=A3IZ88_9CHRO|nr:hypothetical protein [Crocosphaera chwakensis]EAZ88202.1 hypothetical protein CY0110_08581 [Crocosphaera chwakensis CCY0110]
MVIKLDSDFEILRFSDSIYEKITVEIQYKGEQIAQINQDKGHHNFEIEFFVDYIEPNFIPKFRLSDFIIALNKAQEILLEDNHID